MLSIYLCEDEKEQRELYTKIVKDFLAFKEWDAQVVCSAKTPEELLECYNTKQGRGCYILDVELNGKTDGFQLAEKIREVDSRGFLIFLTSHSSLLPNIFKYHLEVLDYIDKGCMEAVRRKLEKSVCKAYERYLAEVNNHDEYVQIHLQSKLIYLKIIDIISVTTSQVPHQLDYQMTNKVVSTYAKLKDVKANFSNEFIQCHRGVLVNRKHILEVDFKRMIVRMKNGTEYPLSYRFKRNLQMRN